MSNQRITRRTFLATAASSFAFTYIPKSVFGANERFYLAGIGVGGKGAGEVRDLTNAGATFVALSNYTFSKTKVLMSTLLILVGQTVASVVIDYIHLGEMISFNAVIGTVLIVLAVILYNSKEEEKVPLPEL